MTLKTSGDTVERVSSFEFLWVTLSDSLPTPPCAFRKILDNSAAKSVCISLFNIHQYLAYCSFFLPVLNFEEKCIACTETYLPLFSR